MSNKYENYLAIGLMSGTSLDGLDVCCVNFSIENKKWNYEILKGRTFEYSDEIKQKLKNCINFSEEELFPLHVELGDFFGEKANVFIRENKFNPLLIASHGHTVFHQPEKGITKQVASGKKIFQATNIEVINNFRNQDVKLGGQGAPLVPIGDKMLFSEYEYCLNLGGIANVSFDDEQGKRRAFDICACNLVLNYLAEQKGELFDKDGDLASKGSVNSDLLHKLNEMDFLNRNYPKSLGKEDVLTNDFTIIDKCEISVEDKLATYVEFIAEQISNNVDNGKMLVTGGGVYNSFLISRIKEKCSNIDVVIPEKELIEFKEAMIFAFMGVLRIRNEVNVLRSVTGASRDSSSGKRINKNKVLFMQ